MSKNVRTRAGFDPAPFHLHFETWAGAFALSYFLQKLLNTLTSNVNIEIKWLKIKNLYFHDSIFEYFYTQ